MANPDILITPGQGTIGFSGTNTGTIQLRVAESGDIHFEGDQGSLLSLSDDLSDSLFSVNDAAGMPVFEVFADDTIKAYRNNETKLEIDPDNNRIRLRDNLLISGDLTVSGSFTQTSVASETHVSGLSGYFGKVGIGYSDNFHPDARLVVGQNPTNGFAIIAGSDNAGVAPQISNSQTKVVRIGMPHYTITEEPVTLMTATSSSSKTDIHIGGGTAFGNSTENMYLRTAASHTTTKGTTALYINNNQQVVVGSLGGLTTAAGLGAALTVSGDASITGELRVKEGIYVSDGDSLGSAYIQLGNSSDYTNFTSAQLHLAGGTNAGFQTAGSRKIFLSDYDNDAATNGVTLFECIDENQNVDIRFLGGSGTSLPGRNYFRGSVGIGTDTPGAFFHVQSGTSDNGGTVLRVGGSSNHTSRIQLVESVNSDNDMTFGFTLGAEGGTNGDATNNFIVKHHQSSVAGGTAASRAGLSVDRASGFVGVGTSDAGDANFRVRGQHGQDVLARITSSNTEKDARLMLGESDTHGMTFEYDGLGNIGYLGMNNNVDPTASWSKRIQMSRDGTEVAFMAGNVGIGTDNPTPGDMHSSMGDAKLHVYDSTSGVVARFQGGSDANGQHGAILINHSNDRGLLIRGGRGVGNTASGSLGLVGETAQPLGNAGGTIHLRAQTSSINGDVFVGIGTSSPTQLLEVDGNIRLGDGNHRNIIGPTNATLGIYANPNDSNEGIKFSTDGGSTIEMFLEDGGNLGIGPDLDPTEKLHVSGNAIIANAHTSNTTVRIGGGLGTSANYGLGFYTQEGAVRNTLLIGSNNGGSCIRMTSQNSSTYEIWADSTALHFDSMNGNRDFYFNSNSSAENIVYITQGEGALGVGVKPSALAGSRFAVSGDASITGELKVDSAGVFRGEGLRDGSWHRGLEITTENSNFASLFFGGQSTTKYSALVWTSSVDGNVGNKRGAQIYGHPSSSTNTDIRFDTNNAVGSSSPTTKMIIRGDGKVGIGTAGPNEKLELYSSSANVGMQIKQDGGSSKNPYILIDGEAGRAGYVKMSTNGTAASQMNFYADDDSLDRVWSINEGANFGDSNADIVLKQGGDVGIGTNHPQGERLHVNGGAIISGTLFVKNDQIWYDANSADVIAKLHDNNDDGIFDIYQNNSVINRIHGNGASYFKGGNVGIGTDTPATKLDVFSSSAALRISASGGTSPQLELSSVGAVNWKLRANISSSDFRITKDSTDYLTILSDGKVGIGTNNPDYTLTVNAGTTNEIARFQSSDNDALISIKDNTDAVYIGLDASADIMSLGFSNSFASTNLNIDTAGNVGIGTTNPNSALHIRRTAPVISLTDSNSFSDSDDRFIFRAGTPDGGFFQWYDDSASTTTNLMFIGADGNVGIGTTNPTGKLHIYQSGDSQPAFLVEGSQGSLFSVEDTLTGSLMSVNDIAGLPVFEAFDDGTIVMGQYNSGDLVVTGNNIGIGTADPTAQLHIKGSDTTDQVIIENTDASSTSAPDLVLYRNSASPAASDNIGLIQFRGRNDNSQDVNYASILVNAVDETDTTEDTKLSFFTYIAGTETESVVIKGGNVGIGTTSPATKLHVYQTAGNTNLRIESTAANSQPQISFKNDARRYNLGMISTDKFILEDETGGGTRLTVDTAGNVGIGTTNPQGVKLHVNGSAIVSGTLFVKNDQIWEDANSTDIIAKLHDNNDDGIFDIYQNNSVVNRIHGNGASYFKGGNVGIGTDDPATLLHIHADSSSSQEIFFDNNGVGSVGATFRTDFATDGGLANFIRFDAADSAGNNTRYSTIESFIVDNTHTTEDGRLTFSTMVEGTDTETMHVSKGNVSIGTTSSAYGRLFVDAATTAANTALAIRGRDASASYIALNVLNNADGAIFSILNNGKTEITHVGGADLDILTLDNNRNTVSDKFGIKFQDSFRTRARIQAINLNAGNAGAALAFEVGFSTDTVERMRINSAGNVGIGTTNPNNTLHVHTASAGSVTADTDRDDLVIENSTNVGLTFLSPNTDKAAIAFGDPQNSRMGLITYDHAHDSLAIRVNNTDNLLTVQSGGEVGVGGTGQHGALFTVHGDASITGDLSVTRFIKHGGDEGTKIDFGSTEIDLFANNVKGISVKTTEVAINDNSADVNFRVESDSNSTMLFVDGGTNRVSIGHSSAEGTFDVNGDAIVRGSLYFDGVSSSYIDNSSHELQLRGAAGVSLFTHVSAGWTERLTVTDPGNVGIGTILPSGILHAENNSTGIIVANDQITGNAFEVFGAQGNLLTVTDDLSDSLFSVNDAAGMPVFEVFADDTIKSYRNNESKLEIDPDNNRIRLRDHTFVSGILTTTGAAVIAGGTRFTVGGTHELSTKLAVSECVGFGESDSALTYFRRFSAGIETFQMQPVHAGTNDGIISVAPYGGELHVGMGNGTTRQGSLLTVNGDAQITGALRVAGNISTAGNLDVPASIRHVGDTNTSIDFAFDFIRLQVGGHDLFNIDEDDGDIVFNESSSKSLDIRMESNSKTNMFFLDASEDKIGIGTTQPLADFEVHGIISGVKSYSQHARFEHRNNSHEDGGTSVLGYNTRAFNKTIVNNGGFVTTGANTFTLSQGLYWVVAETTQSAEGFIQLRNNSDSAFINHYRSSETLQSVNAKGSSTSDYVPHHLQGVFYLGSSKTIELQSFVADPRSNDGFGGPITDDSNVGSADYTDDVYAWIEFWKISPTG